MCEILSKKEMIHWIVENSECSNTDIPDWLLELSEPIEGDPKFRNCNFRELLQIMYINSHGKAGMVSLEMEGFDTTFEWYASRILHFLDVERQRRIAPYFEFNVENVFSADENVHVFYDKCDNGPITFSRKEIIRCLKVEENNDEEDWDILCEDEEDDYFDTDSIEVNNKYDNQFLIKRFGKTMDKHSQHTRFMINTTGTIDEYYFKTKYDRLQGFLKAMANRIDDIYFSMSIYFDRRVLLPKAGKNILSVYVKHRRIGLDMMERKFDEIAGFMDDCVGCDKMPLNGTAEFVGYFAPRNRTLYIKKDL